MTGRALRSLQSIALTLLLVVFAIATVSAAVNAEDQPPAAQVSSASVQSPPPSHHSASRSSYDDRLSQRLNDYLHSHHLPFVDAMVFSNASGDPSLLKLSGQVRTEHGKEDAATKSTDFLNQPRLRIQNRIEVNATLDSAAPAASSAAAGPAASTYASAPPGDTPAASAPSDPCSDLCYKDEGHCKTGCSSQATSGASGGGWQQMLGQVGQSAGQLNQCNDQCVQTREHCIYDCRQGGNPGGESADSGAAHPDASDHGEGPNTPPE